MVTSTPDKRASTLDALHAHPSVFFDPSPILLCDSIWWEQRCNEADTCCPGTQEITGVVYIDPRSRVQSKVGKGLAYSADPCLTTCNTGKDFLKGGAMQVSVVGFSWCLGARNAHDIVITAPHDCQFFVNISSKLGKLVGWVSELKRKVFSQWSTTPTLKHSPTSGMKMGVIMNSAPPSTDISASSTFMIVPIPNIMSVLQ